MNTILWTIFEILINVFQGFALCYYSYRYMNNKGIKPFIFSTGSVFSIIIAATITILNYVTIFEHLLALVILLATAISSRYVISVSIIISKRSSLISSMWQVKELSSITACISSFLSLNPEYDVKC